MNELKLFQLHRIYGGYANEEPPKTSDHAPHVHPYPEIYYLICGHIQYQVESTIYDMQPGDMIIINAGEEHVARVLSTSEPYERIGINFSPNLLDESCRKFLEPFQKREPGTRNLYPGQLLQDKLILLCMERLIRQPNCSEDRATVYLHTILQEVYDLFVSRTQLPKPDHLTSTGHISQKIHTYIEQHADCINNLQTLSDYFGMSTSRMSRIFRTVYGQPIWSYVMDKKLKLAHYMLTQGSRPTKVAANCGFNEYSTFYNAYKKKFGRNPNQDCSAFHLSPGPSAEKSASVMD